MKLLKHLLPLLFTLLMLANISACSDETDTSESCPITVDTVNVLVTKEYSGTKYYLVKRITGWHDKTIVIQLFNKEPKFGSCNEDLVKPLFEDSIETDRPLEKLSVDINNNKYDFIYSDKSISDNDIKLEFKHD